MAKTKTPFLSLGASGSVGGSITAQKRYDQTLVRRKPFPTDRYTLSQAYQRWLYQDYAHLWLVLTPAQQATYRSEGAKYHRTAFQQWMHYSLSTLPYLSALWDLDETAGSAAHDQSSNGITATIYGASPVIGLIDHARSFDGINDYIRALNKAPLQLTTTFSIEWFMKCLHVPDYSTAWGEFIFMKSGSYFLSVRGNVAGRAVIKGYFWTGPADFTSAQFDPQQWNHFMFTYDHAVERLYLNGTLLTTKNTVGSCPKTASPLDIGNLYGDGTWLKAITDHIALWTITLDSTLAERHAERRYPA